MLDIDMIVGAKCYMNSYELCGILEAEDGWWSSSLVESLVENDLYIRATSDPPTTLPSESEILCLATDLSTDLTTHAQAAECQEVDELVRLRAGQCWIFPHLDASNPRAENIRNRGFGSSTTTTR